MRFYKITVFLCLLSFARAGAEEVSRDDLMRTLDLAKRTLIFVEKSAACPDLAKELSELEKKIQDVLPSDRNITGQLSAEARNLRRRIIFSHPLLNFDRLLINKRPPPYSIFTHQCDQYYGRHSKAGPGLVILENWKGTPKETVLLEGRLPEGSVLHPDLSFDAERILFSFCDHTVPKGSDVHIPTHPKLLEQGFNYEDIGHRRFFIYEIDIKNREVRQLTGTASDSMERAGGRETVLIEDFDPCYLPDGSFAFTSTRCQGFGRCHWGRYTPSFLLYKADSDGSNIRPVSFGEANEWDPSVLSDGRIIYTRWDYINRHNTWFQSLWLTNPDGTGTSHYYGNYSQNPCSIAEARSIPGSHKVVATATAHHLISAGSIIIIDPRKGQDGMEPLTRLTPEINFPETEGWNLPGCYAEPYPLSEDLFLAAYSPEIVKWETSKGQYNGTWPSTNAFGIYLVDTLGGRELIYRDPSFSCFTPIPVVPRPVPVAIPSMLPQEKVPDTGICYLQNVYISSQPIPKGSIKQLRINRIFNQPTASVAARSPASEEIVKGVIGTVPVKEDGSAAFRVPAGVPMQLQALDENGMAVMTMRSFIYLQPGEKIGCVGCHEERTTTPYVRPVQQMEIHDPRPITGVPYEGGMSFRRTVQPVLDRHCIRCHGLKKGEQAGKLNLLANVSYRELIGRPGMVTVVRSNSETFFSKPKDYFAWSGKLAPMLLKGHQKLSLPRDDMDRLIAWMDLNGQEYGDYSFNRLENRGPDTAGQRALREYIKGRFGDELASQPYEALVNTGNPLESRILMAPLSEDAGGWGQISRYGWMSRDDPSYGKMLQLVEESIAPLQFHDIKGTCGRETCICGSCWVRKLLDAEHKP